MKLGKSPEAMHLAYSFVTAFAPTAVSSAYAKPSLYRTVSIWAKFFRRKDDMNEGATLATTLSLSRSRLSTSSFSLWTILAF